MGRFEDDSLLRRFREGDPDAFGALFDAYAARLEARIRRRLDHGL